LQQLLDRLSCFSIRPAVLPTLLAEPPEDHQEEGDEVVEVEAEPVEDVETEELMRSLASKRSPSARFRWRRSRWLRSCPVALADGIIAPGKSEFAVSYDALFFAYCSLYLVCHFNDEILNRRPRQCAKTPVVALHQGVPGQMTWLEDPPPWLKLWLRSA